MAGQDSGRPPPEAFHRVEDEEQARMLMDEEVLRFFRPFLARETTVGRAAAEAACRPSVMLYRVGTFLRAGLLRVVREEPRAGRALKVYRSVHDAYLVPYALTPFATLEEAFYAGYEENARRIARLTARRYRGRRWDGYRLYRDPGGETWREGAPDASRFVDLEDPERPLGLDYMIEVRMAPSDARALQARLAGYLRRYRTEPGREGDAGYVLSVAFVPSEGEP